MISKLKLLRLYHFKHPIKNIKNFLFSKPNRFNFLANIYTKFTKVSSPEKWVFIVGCYNSGTTLLLRLLDNYRDISTLYEGVFKTSELNTPEELGWTRLWYKVYEQVRLSKNNDGINVNNLKKDWSIFLNNKKKIFVEKSIVNSTRMAWLQENFKNSYFIFIVRNGYCVSEGIKRKAPKGAWGIQKKDYQPSYPIEMCAKQWIYSNKIIEKDSRNIKRFFKIKYEDLCVNPEKTLKNIYKFLNIPSGNQFNKEKKWNIHGEKSEIKNMNYKSFERLSSFQIKKINQIAEKMLGYYGYDIL